MRNKHIFLPYLYYLGTLGKYSELLGIQWYFVAYCSVCFLYILVVYILYLYLVQYVSLDCSIS